MKKILLLTSLIIIEFAASCSHKASLQSTNTAASSSGNTQSKSENISEQQNDSTSNNQPPVGVTEGFRKKYPDYTPGDWTKNESQYRTTYMQESRTYRSEFTEGGEWVTTEFDITKENLPKPVLEAFQKSEFGKANNPRFAQLETSKYPTLFRVEGKLNNEPFILLYSPQGQLIPNE